MKFQIGTGHTIKFWSDLWFPSLGLLTQWVISDYPIDPNAKIADFLLSTGHWNEALLSNYFSQNVIHEITSVEVNVNSPHDSVSWSASVDGTFYIKSAVLSIRDHHSHPNSEVFKKVWFWAGPQRIKTFLWLLASDSLLSNSNRVRRHLTDQASCTLCNHHTESNLHAIRDCSWARQVWKSFIHHRNQREFFNLNLHDWLLFNFSTMQGDASRKSWPLTFGLIAAGVWAGRNAFIFYGVALNIPATCRSLKHQVDESVRVFISPSRQHLALGSSNIRGVRWEPPDDGCIKLNSDGAAVNNSHYGACGGVFRNHHGNFLLAFSHCFDKNSPLEAELLGILKGLHLAWDYHYYNLIVEVDCAHAIRLINSGFQDPHPLKKPIDPIQSILTRHWCVRFHHVLREANQPADMIAAFGLHQTNSDSVFNEILLFYLLV
ncbi:Ribonuclease H domain [Sesbania bispinosa]|nr:Ribonuclease H domain [Sesbania bispinosa]